MMSLEILTNTQTDEFSRSEKNEGERWLWIKETLTPMRCVDGWSPSTTFIFSIVRKGELLLSRRGCCQDVQDDHLIREGSIQLSSVTYWTYWSINLDYLAAFVLQLTSRLIVHPALSFSGIFYCFLHKSDGFEELSPT